MTTIALLLLAESTTSIKDVSFDIFNVVSICTGVAAVAYAWATNNKTRDTMKEEIGKLQADILKQSDHCTTVSSCRSTELATLTANVGVIKNDVAWIKQRLFHGEAPPPTKTN